MAVSSAGTRDPARSVSAFGFRRHREVPVSLPAGFLNCGFLLGSGDWQVPITDRQQTEALRFPQFGLDLGSSGLAAIVDSRPIVDVNVTCVGKRSSRRQRE